jgi:hypothetical protein
MEMLGEGGTWRLEWSGTRESRESCSAQPGISSVDGFCSRLRLSRRSLRRSLSPVFLLQRFERECSKPPRAGEGGRFS